MWPLPRSLLGMLRSHTVPSAGQFVRTMGRPIHVTRAGRGPKVSRDEFGAIAPADGYRCYPPTSSRPNTPSSRACLRGRDWGRLCEGFRGRGQVLFYSPARIGPKETDDDEPGPENDRMRSRPGRTMEDIKGRGGEPLPDRVLHIRRERLSERPWRARIAAAIIRPISRSTSQAREPRNVLAD